jgi:hypothetical protein
MSMGKLYRRIDFIHKQCLSFVGERERRLYERMYLCTDRQVHISNWTNRKEKQNCESTIPRNDYGLWVFNPTPSMNEVDKHVAACTNIDRYDTVHQANLYKKASLHAIDRFFMQIRRKASVFERPKKTGNRNAGTWYGYQPYNPELFVKLGDIFRVFYNYCLPDEKNKQTPAMKLGLAKSPVKVEKSSILTDISDS